MVLNPQFPGRSRKDELEAQIQRGQEQYAAFKQKRAEEKKEHAAENAAYAEQGKVFVEEQRQAELREAEHKKIWKEQHDARRRAVVEEQERKKKLQAHEEQLKKDKQAEHEREVAYREQLGKQSREMFLKDKRKHDAEEAHATIIHDADVAARAMKDEARKEQMYKNNAIEAAGRKKRGDIDIHEKFLLEESERERREARSKLDVWVRNQEFEIRHNLMGLQKQAQEQQATAKLRADARRREEKIELEAKARQIEIKRKMQMEREKEMREEREEKNDALLERQRKDQEGTSMIYKSYGDAEKAQRAVEQGKDVDEKKK